MLRLPFSCRAIAASGWLCWAAATPATALAADPTLEQAIGGANRSSAFVSRDAARHPLAELRFFSVTPRSHVVEIWPGGGYWTEILAPFLRDHGEYTIAVDVPNGEPEGQNFALGPKFAARLDANPADYGRIHYVFFGAKQSDLPLSSADVILTFRNLHNWVNQEDADRLLASLYRALKPGGVLGVEDHRGNPRLPQDPKARFGYLRQDYAVALVEKAGFKLVATSEMDANPRDTADYPRGVWTLPPSFALGNADRARYAAIGEADNFVLKFRKPG